MWCASLCACVNASVVVVFVCVCLLLVVVLFWGVCFTKKLLCASRPSYCYDYYYSWLQAIILYSGVLCAVHVRAASVRRDVRFFEAQPVSSISGCISVCSCVGVYVCVCLE